ncbi:WYL domain-containing protein [Clostridium sediminicola]|uniref:helix-turn-helix transcriptional regulator n=1 Tax=Clostridium sediminicola TaxID=3114879 RepID=UPI0031F1D22E
MKDYVKGYRIKKPQALLIMYRTLISGGRIKKKKFVEDFNVNEKTIERYIKDINRSFEDEGKSDFFDMKIEYDKKEKIYELKSKDSPFFTKEEILSISKICLESRGLSKNQMEKILKKLIKNHCYSDWEDINKIIFREKNTYHEPKHKDENLINKIWDLTKAIRENRKMTINYRKVGKNGKLSEKITKRKLIPSALLFSEFYFYLIAFIEWDDGNKSSKVIPYRVDRILSYELLDEGYRLDSNSKVDDGELREDAHYMQFGELERVEFRFSGKSIEAVEDKLPNAEIKDIGNGEYIVRVKGYVKGLKMWLLSQGAAVEVLKPDGFRKEMAEEVEKMVLGYRGK